MTHPHPVAYWRQEHQDFARLLHVLQKQVDALHTPREPDYALMLDIVSYLREYTDVAHHPREDVAFERLARYCPDLELPLARLQQEHRVIAHAGEVLSGQIAAVLRGAIVAREVLEATASTYLVYYQHHLDVEDSRVLERAAQHLTAEDWDAVRRAARSLDDPLFGEKPSERFKRLRREIAERQAA